MKPNEIRGLPVEEVQGMLLDEQEKLANLRFQHSLHQLEDKKALNKTRREISRLKTIIREEELKTRVEEAQKLLKEISQKHKMPSLESLLAGEKVGTDLFNLRKAVKRLEKRKDAAVFGKELRALKNIVKKQF